MKKQAEIFMRLKLILLVNIFIVYLVGLGFNTLFIKISFMGLIIINLLFIFTLIKNTSYKIENWGIETLILILVSFLSIILLVNGSELIDAISYSVRPLYYLSVFFLFYLYTKFGGEETEILSFLRKILLTISGISLFLYIAINSPVLLSINNMNYSILIDENFFGKNIITGPFISVNEFADLQLFLLIFSLVGVSLKERNSVYSLLISITIMFMTISRTTIIIGFMLILLYLIFNKQLVITVAVFIKKKIINSKKISTSLIAGLIGIGFLIVKYTNILYFFHKFKQKNLFSGREYLWDAAINVIRDNLWLGTPIHKIQDSYNKYFDPSTNLTGLGAHNTYLHLLTQVGVVGFLIIFLFILIIVTRIKIKGLDKRLLFIYASLFILVFVRGIVESGLLYVFSVRILLVWLLLGVVMGKSFKGRGFN